MMEIDTPQGKLALQIGGTIDRLDSKGDTLRIVDYKARRYSQDSRKYRTTVYSRRQPSQLYFPDVSVRRHPLPQAIAEGSPFPALHPPGSFRKLLPGHRNGSATTTQGTGQQLRFLRRRVSRTAARTPAGDIQPRRNIQPNRGYPEM